MMPLLFAVSGARTFYAPRRRGGVEFLKDHTLRLLVPLLVGIFTHVAWQVYLDRVTHHRFTGSFWQFCPHYFDGWFEYGGNFAWMGLHLWYLELLFVFSIVFLPLFLWLRRGAGRDVLACLGDRLATPGAVYLGLYRFVIRPFNPLRFLFGMKPRDGRRAPWEARARQRRIPHLAPQIGG